MQLCGWRSEVKLARKLEVLLKDVKETNQLSTGFSRAPFCRGGLAYSVLLVRRLSHLAARKIGKEEVL
jgi:hypothetical protein